MLNCYCGNTLSYQLCCAKYISGTEHPKTPEQLMRSRYSAYVAGEFDYIHQTYSEQHTDIPSSEEIRHSAQDTTWLQLTIESSNMVMNNGEVEFRALYQQQGTLYQLHEHSYFITEKGQWRYLRGDILADSGAL
ncbi:YchJ family protein [Neptunicella sp.]|uniref:YchJ family protein n=1 Tax=Neptunicella sp. TaxID=2125986 RepID=UPI003F6932F9